MPAGCVSNTPQSSAGAAAQELFVVLRELRIPVSKLLMTTSDLTIEVVDGTILKGK